MSAKPRRSAQTRSARRSTGGSRRGEHLVGDGSIVLCGDDLSENAWFADVAHGVGLSVLREADIRRLHSWYSPDHGPILLSADTTGDEQPWKLVPADIRTRVVPVTWRQQWSGIRAWLEHGAVDFIRMPAPEAEVVLRIHSALARFGAAGPLAPRSDTRESALLAELSKREQQLYSVFKARAGEVMTRQTLRELAWGESDAGMTTSNAIDVYVCYLRGKLAASGIASTLETVRGHGYVFRSRPEQPRD